jgi:hypothetical protein
MHYHDELVGCEIGGLLLAHNLRDELESMSATAFLWTRKEVCSLYLQCPHAEANKQRGPEGADWVKAW